MSSVIQGTIVHTTLVDWKHKFLFTIEQVTFVHPLYQICKELKLGLATD
jgi:hypothetical protein